MFFNFRQGYQVMKDHSNITKMHFWMIQSTKNEVFWTWVRRIDLILHIIIELNVFQRLATQPGHERAFKSPLEKHFWMIQSAKKEVFGHYLELGQLDWADIAYDDRTIWFTPFGNTTSPWKIIQKSQKAFLNDPKYQEQGFLDLGVSDRLDIAYYDRTQCFPTFGNTTRSWRSIQKSKKSFHEWSKVPRRRFLAIILSCWIELILPMMIEQYDFHHLATLPVHEGSFKSPKKHFWIIQSAKSEVFLSWSKVPSKSLSKRSCIIN